MFSLDRVLAASILLGFIVTVVGLELRHRRDHYYQPRRGLLTTLIGVAMIGGGLYQILSLGLG